jgi:hypothetical protein
MSNLEQRLVARCFLIALLALVSIESAHAQDWLEGDAFRGGWVADVGDARHIYIFKVRGTEVTGTYCPIDCAHPDNVSFVRDGEIDGDTIRFTLLHDIGDSIPVRGELVGDALVLTPDGRLASGMPGGAVTFRRDPRRPVVVRVDPDQVDAQAGRGGAAGRGGGGRGRGYVAPGPSEPLSPEKVEGLWVWGTGPAKQHFIFRQVGDEMLGMVCGACDDPGTFGPLDNFRISGETMTFDIVHEDWGFGIEYGPFLNHATISVSHHEMRLNTLEELPTGNIEIEMILHGPIRVD